MKTKKSKYVERFTIGANADTVKAIQKSGESAGDWFRQAAQSRLESGRQPGGTAGMEEKPMEALKQNMTDLRKEIAKLQQSEAITQATQAEIQKSLAIVQQNQEVLHQSLKDLDQGFGQSLNALGRLLLTKLSPPRQEMAQAPEELELFKIRPVPPRTRL